MATDSFKEWAAQREAAAAATSQVKTQTQAATVPAGMPVKTQQKAGSQAAKDVSSGTQRSEQNTARKQTASTGTARTTNTGTTKPITGGTQRAAGSSDFQAWAAQREQRAAANNPLRAIAEGRVEPKYTGLELGTWGRDRQAQTSAPQEEKKVNIPRLLLGTAEQGSGQVVQSVTGLADFLFGGLAEEVKNIIGLGVDTLTGGRTNIQGMKNPITALNDRVKETNAREQQYFSENVEGNKTAEAVNKYGTMTMAAVPMALAAVLTGGASAATTEGLAATAAIEQSAGLSQIANIASSAIKTMAKDPNTQLAWIQATGSSYEDAKNDGASDIAAAAYALINGSFNALVEVGGADESLGGIQKLPKSIRDALQRGENSVVLQWVKSILGEMKEEVEQGVLERGLKSMYQDVPLYSATDPNAILQPQAMKEEATGAAIVSALLGGGQIAAERAINAAAQRNESQTRNPLAEVSTDQVEQLRNAAADALTQEDLDETTKAQLRVLQTAAEMELQGRTDNYTQPEVSNHVENQTQAEQRILGQEETFTPTGETPRRERPAGYSADESTAGTAAAEPGRSAEVPDGNRGRDAGTGLGREPGRVERSTEELRRRAAEQHRAAVARQSLGNALWSRGEITRQSAQELGITSGTDTPDLLAIPQEHYDEEMRQVADWVAAEYGLPVTFVTGLISVNTPRGRQKVRGVYTGNGIIIRADSPTESVTAIAKHEVFHDESRRDTGLLETMRKKLTEQYGRDEMQKILTGYIKALRGQISVNANTDMDHLDAAAWEIFEEVCADAYAGMNAFGLSAYRYEGTVREVLSERRGFRDQNRSGQRETRGPPPERMSYGGETAWDADIPALTAAINMEKEGTDPETIRLDTGWFRGMDGQWRFEIDDSEMQLRDGWRSSLAKQQSGDGMTLNDLISHENLFNQYPDLKYIDIAFDINEESSTLGQYQAPTGYSHFKGPDRDGHISLNEQLLQPGREGELLDTLIHEVQHAIQDTENFTRGSSPRAWQRRIDRGYDNRMPAAKQAALQAKEEMQQLLRNEPEYYQDMIDLMNDVPTAPRGAIDWNTLEQIEDDPQEWQDWDARRDAMEEKYGDRIFRFVDLYNDLNGTGKNRRDAQDLYFNTAGEIEARDTEYRRSLDRERRQETPPRRATEYTVFAEEGDESFSLRDKKIPTREELEAKDDIPVVDIREETSGSYKEQREAFLKSEEAQALYREPALNRDTNEPLFIIPASITHTFSNAGQENILLAKHLREIAENAVLTHGEPSRSAPDDHTTGVYKFFGAVQTPDGVQPVKLTVKEYNVEGQGVPKAVLDYVGDLQEGDTYAPIYDGKVLVLEDVEKETSSSAPSSTRNESEPDKHPSVSTISVKDLLNLVKGEDTKYIPQHKAADNIRFSAEEPADDYEQLSFDDITYGEYSGQTHASIRERLENADALRQRVKDYFRSVDPESNWHLTDEQIDDLMEVNPYGNFVNGDMNAADDVMISLANLAEEAEPGRRMTETFELMEDLLDHMPRTVAGSWIDNERYEPINETFADWYEQRHPPLYYPGYRREGGLGRNRRNLEHERDYLKDMLDRGRFIGQDKTHAESLLRAVNEQLAGTGRGLLYSTEESEIEGAIYGDSDETYVNDTEPVKFRWAVVPLESLIISNDTSGSINPAYPKELQPRDRTRTSSQLDVQRISRNLNPRQLEASPNAQNGAPIVRDDGVVISGNLRSMAITDAYQNSRAENYRRFIEERASRYGIDASTLPEHPVLVRVADQVEDWTKLARDANTSTVTTYSATERAMQDAGKLTEETLQLLNPSEDGEINNSGNRAFIQDFLQKVVPDSERNAMVTANGLLSQEGLTRAEYAIFAKAYGDTRLLQRMSESLDNDMKNVTNALLDVAPGLVQIETAVENGNLYDVRLRDNILDALQLYTEAKAKGMTVDQFTANHSMDESSNETIYLARFMEDNKRSTKRIREFINNEIDEVESYGSPDQIGFFDEEGRDYTYRDVLKGAIKRYERETGTGIPGLDAWGAGSYEADPGRSEAGREPEPVPAVYDPGNGEAYRETGSGPDTLGGVREEPAGAGAEPGTGAGAAADRSDADTAGELEWNGNRQTQADETRQRDLERMRDRMEKDREKLQKKKKKQRTKFPNMPEYDPLAEFRGSKDPFKEYVKAAQAKASAEKMARMMQTDKENFTGTKALQQLGVRIQGSVGNFAHVDQLISRERSAAKLRKEIRREEGRLNATKKEKEFAAGIVSGVYTIEDVPASMSRYKVEILTDYYWAERAVASDMISQRRKDINQGLDEQMDELLQDSELYKVPPAMILNYRTPERLCRSIFGDEHGKAVYDAIFRPVAVNEAERTRFINRMFDEVRTFAGKDGTRTELNKEERMLVQQVLEGRAATELTASMEMHEAIETAANNMNNGESRLDAGREWGLSDYEMQIAEQYARWLQTKAVYDSGNFDTVKIDNAVKKYSEMYDTMYDAINDFLVAHGYDPIGFIHGYAPHMQMGEDLNVFAGYLERMGFNANVTRLPTSIAGRTGDFKPNKRWNPYFLTRTGELTDFDIAEGYQSYVDYLSDVLYHTDDVMRVRAMSRYYRRMFAPEEIKNNLEWIHNQRNASTEMKETILKDRGILSRDSQLSERDIQAQFDEWVDKQYDYTENMTKYSDYVTYLENYANLLAGKQTMADRGAEALLGRESLTFGNKMLQAFQRAQVAGNLSSALNQSAQLPMIQAELGSRYTMRAAADIMAGKCRNTAWAQESDFLTGKRGVSYLVTDRFDMLMQDLFKPLEWVDGLMSTLAVRGRYLKEIDAGRSHAEAMKAADDFGKKVMGSRTKGSKPTAFNSKRLTAQMLNVFQIEALNSWEHLTQDLPEDFRAIEKQKGTEAAAGALAGVIVKMLLSAFLLNRLGEELYGGTPAPFDLIGLSCNFIASGRGLTTNQWLLTVLDNGLEKLIGERVLNTDPEAGREDFAWEEALEDTSYNVSNDIPFLRNIAALMGWGDQTLPLPLMGSGKDLKYLFQDLKADIGNGRLTGQTGMDLLRIMNQVLPGGRQLTKAEEGLLTMAQGGRYVNGKLYYPVENTIGNWAKAVLFGRGALNESDAYYAAGSTGKLGETQTELYRILTESGTQRRDAYEAMQESRDLSEDQRELLERYASEGEDAYGLFLTMQDYKAINADENLGSYEKGRQKRAAITNTDLTDSQKLELFRTMEKSNAGRADDFEDLMKAGMSWAATVNAYDHWAEINADDTKKASAKAETWAAWVERQNYSDEEKDAIKAHFKFYQSIAIEGTKVEKFTGAGMEVDAAEQLSETLQNLQPLPGRTYVTDLQKYQAIAASTLTTEEQWTAIVAQTPESYTSTLDKIAIMRTQGISPQIWVQSKQAMYDADDAGNNNDSTDQQEAKAALDAMDISNDNRAILWQLTNKSWKAKKNPYDREIGQAVYDMLHGSADTQKSLSKGTQVTLPNGAAVNVNQNGGSLQLGTWGGDPAGSGATSKGKGTQVKLPNGSVVTINSGG